MATIGRCNGKKAAFVFVAIVVLSALAWCGTAAAELPPNHANAQVLMYIIGSDLESEGGAASSDMNDVVTSYGKTDPASLDIVVAFGGAKKAGWEGIKIATMDDLARDAQDGTFGNGPHYAYSDPGADMGSVSTFEKFLNVVKESRPATRTILLVSDHGSSYNGIGPDENTGNVLGMDDFDKALKESGTQYEPFMFDACLMSSAEVAKTVRPYTSLMIGSEEIEMGGYDYSSAIHLLVQDPETDSVTLAKAVVDGFVDMKDVPTSARTMSVIDVTKVPDLLESLDRLGEQLVTIAETEQGLHDLKSAYNDAIMVGQTSKDASPVGVDLVSLLENIGKKRPELSSDVEETINLVKNVVVYERHNEYSQAVSGISIASPDAITPENYRSYGEAVNIAPHWNQFFEKMIAVSNEGPAVLPGEKNVEISKTPAFTAYSPGQAGTTPDEDGDSSGQAGDARFLARSPSKLSKPGFTTIGNGTVRLDDPYHDAEVSAVYYVMNGTDALEIGTQPVSNDTAGLYHVPEWDGRWYYFPGPVTRQGNLWDWFLSLFSTPVVKRGALLVDMEYEDVTVGGHTIYDSLLYLEGMGRDTDAVLTTYVNQGRGTFEYVITPYTVTAEDIVAFGDGASNFTPGSRVTSYTSGFNTVTGNTRDSILSTTVAGTDMKMDYTLLPDGTYATGIMAYYDEDQEVLAGQFRTLTIKNGALVSSTIGPLPGAKTVA